MFYDNEKLAKVLKKVLCIGIPLIIGIIIFANSTVIVPAGHTGVPVTLGAVNEDVTLSEGFHFKMPFVTKIVKVDNRVKQVTAGAGSASRDLQNVSSSVSINYRIVNNQSSNLYKTVGLGIEEVIVKPAIQECVKAVTAKYTAEELIIKRQIVSVEMQEILEEKVRPYGISVEIFNITDFNFSEEFNRAIEQKSTAQQLVLAEQQQLEKEKIIAQQAVEKAKGEAISRKEQAKGEAAAIRAKAEADAYAIEVIQQQLASNPLYLEYVKLMEWDGKLPQVVSGGDMLIGWGN